jgi:hypothetical protein
MLNKLIILNYYRLSRETEICVSEISERGVGEREWQDWGVCGSEAQFLITLILTL